MASVPYLHKISLVISLPLRGVASMSFQETNTKENAERNDLQRQINETKIYTTLRTSDADTNTNIFTTKSGIIPPKLHTGHINTVNRC